MVSVEGSYEVLDGNTHDDGRLVCGRKGMDGRDIGSKERLLKACFSMAVNLKPQRTSNLGPDPAFHIWKLGSDVTPFRL